MPSDGEIKKLHQKYAPNQKVFDLVYIHCMVVCEIAEWAAGRNKDKVDFRLLRAACLLHDIGTYVMFDNEGHVHNQRMYAHARHFGRQDCAG